MEAEKIKQFARQYTFHDVKLLGEYKGFTVYDCIFTDGKTHCIGYPHFIFVKGDNITMHIDEHFEVLDYFYPDDED